MTQPTRQIYVNLPVAELERTRAFFTALGFSFNDQLSDGSTALCMIVNEHAGYMMLTHEKFASFTRQPVIKAEQGTGALHAFTVGSRQEVDATFARALEAGGRDAQHIEDHGFMYSRSFHDPDGHTWEAFWMDPNAMNG